LDHEHDYTDSGALAVTNQFLIALSALSIGMVGGLLVAFGTQLFFRLERKSEGRRAEEPDWVLRLSAASFFVGTVVVVSTIIVVELVGGGSYLIPLSLSVGVGFGIAAEVRLAGLQRDIARAPYDIFPPDLGRDRGTTAA
jgi:hypothetical protein